MMDALKRAIDQVQAVSFDIFDTLVVRPYRKPTDLFRHLETAMGAEGFAQARMEGEQAARKGAERRGSSEVTLSEIYRELHASYQPLMEKEVQLETWVCRQNPEMFDAFTYARDGGKRIVIASDMYLPQQTIERILQNAGYTGYELLLLSSHTFRPKVTGAMFEDILAATQVPADQILHVGDNAYSDVLVPGERGLRTYHYQTAFDTYGNLANGAFFGLLNQYENQSLFASMLQGLVANRAARGEAREGDAFASYWTDFGYKYMGPMALAYARWMKEQFEKEGISKAFFMLRDGYIFKRVFDLLYPDFETAEIYGSRRMFLFPGIENVDNLIGHTVGVTFSVFYQRLGIEDEGFQKAYEDAFPEGDRFIQDEIPRLKSFLEDHLPFFQEQGKRDMEDLDAYFSTLHLYDGKNAVVDLGWRASMMKGIEKVYKSKGQVNNLYGYFVGTHAFNPGRCRVSGFCLNNGEPAEGLPNRVLNQHYIVMLLELAFSAPHPSVLTLRKEADGSFAPVYQPVHPREQERMEICGLICEGVLDFVQDYLDVTEGFPAPIRDAEACMPLEYLAEHLSVRDEDKIRQVYIFPGSGNDTTHYPISRNLGGFAIVYPWPGQVNAESELLKRIRRATQNLGFYCVWIDNFGYVLDENQLRTAQLIKPTDFDFAITLHYESHKAVDNYYYHTVWNPPEVPLNCEPYGTWLSNDYLMNDDYLIYDEGSMRNHIRSVLVNLPRTLKDASFFSSSFSSDTIFEPNLDDPKMFYCGMNWDRLVHGTDRHNSLFKLLDDTGHVKFFGPDVVDYWGGLRPWEGYKCYQYPIPFDGISILSEISACGICLVLSSNMHRRAGAATTRIYEACAAGAVVISDDNAFIKKYFGDSVLYINYNKADPAYTCAQIMEKYQWIVSHKEEALAMARRSQRIFLDSLTLEKQLINIFNNHPARMRTIAGDLFARDEGRRVLVLMVLGTLDMEQAKADLDQFMYNVGRQVYANIIPVVMADTRVAGEAQAYCNTRLASVRVLPVPYFDQFGVQMMTEGQAFYEAREQVSHDLFIKTSGNETWFYDHVTTLVRTLENEGAVCAYSGRLREDGIDPNRKSDFFLSLSMATANQIDTPTGHILPSGQFIFDARCHEQMPYFLFDSLDGLEHTAYLNVSWHKMKETPAFSKRMTFSYLSDRANDFGHVMEKAMQIRFIQDLVKFDMPTVEIVHHHHEQPAPPPAPAGDGVSAKQTLVSFPLKLWLKVRYYKSKLGKSVPGSAKHTKYARLYEETLQQFMTLWNA